MYGMFGGMALFTVLYLYKPDTTVQTWALAEAVRRPLATLKVVRADCCVIKSAEKEARSRRWHAKVGKVIVSELSLERGPAYVL